MKLAVVMVHYRTPELVAPAWERLQRDAAASGLELEAVVVDHGGGDGLGELPLRVVAVDGNPGYAAGVNRGVAETAGEVIVAMNPDVLVEPGCLAALVAELAAGAAVVGPRFFWDRERLYHLPPNERRDPWSELLGVLAARGEPWRRAARARWRAHVHRQWQAVAPRRSRELSGALLAFRRDAWSQVGPLDATYRLYFEEVDWLDRVVAAGAEPRFVPAAEAIHLHARSTLLEPRAESWFVESSRRYRRRRHGTLFTRLLEALARPPRPEPAPTTGGLRLALGADSPAVESLPPETAWLEATPRPEGFPAVGRSRLPARGEALFAPELWSRLPPGKWRLRALSREGRELASAGFGR